MTTPLLTTKFFPPPPGVQLVSRPRLTQRIADGLGQGRKLTLVSAPAGFGKTTLVTDACRQVSQRLAWLSLDASDNDLNRFWRYVATALKRVEPAVSDLVPAMLEAAQPPPVETILITLINDLANLDELLLLVLDDYQSIEKKSIHASLNFFLDHLPPCLHLVITTRSDPPLSLALRRGRSELIELRAADLRFNVYESIQFLNDVMKLGIPQQDVEMLTRRTEGWIAGLQMAAISLQHQEDAHSFIASLAGDDHYIGDYLAEEVLQRQPEDIQKFLLQTAVLDKMCGELCDALTGRRDGQAVLTALEHANLFVSPLDNRHEWYCYHNLFSELLQRQMRQVFSDEDERALHLQASRWYAEHKNWNDSLQHALLANEAEYAVELLDGFSAEMFSRSEIPQWREWARKLPLEQVLSKPTLCIYWGWAGLSTGFVDEAERAIAAIEKTMGIGPELLLQEGLDITSLTPGVLVILVILAMQKASIQVGKLNANPTIAFSKAVLNCLAQIPENDAYRGAQDLITIAHFNLGLAYEHQGKIELASEAFNQAAIYSRKYMNLHTLPMAMSHIAQLYMIRGEMEKAVETYQEAFRISSHPTGSPSPLISVVHAGLGETLYERNELEQARFHFEQSLRLGKSWNNWESLIRAYPGLAKIYQAKGNHTGALALLDEADELWKQVSPQEPVTFFGSLRSLLSGDPGNMSDALKMTYDFIPQARVNYPFYYESSLILQTRLLMALGRFEEALTVVDPIVRHAEEENRVWTAVRALVLQSLVLCHLRREPEALEFLTHALQLSEPCGYIRVFVDEGLPVARLLYQIAEQANLGGQLSFYCSRLLAAFPEAVFAEEDHVAKAAAFAARQASGGKGELLEPLTGRELEVLHWVSEGLTNQEIAARLVISAGTVKVHTNNIYAKLGVNSRTAAVSKARALGILP